MQRVYWGIFGILLSNGNPKVTECSKKNPKATDKFNSEKPLTLYGVTPLYLRNK